MYIGEGYKRSRNTVSICNSDPVVITMSDRWIRRLTTRPVEYGISYHADQDVELLRAFWADQLGIDRAEIQLHRKSNSSQLKGRVWRCRHGVLTVKTNDTYFRTRLEAWINTLKREWGREEG